MSYVFVSSKNRVVIPQVCPKCGHKLKHTNAVDTICRLYVVFCPSWGCMWGEVYKFL